MSIDTRTFFQQYKRAASTRIKRGYVVWEEVYEELCKVKAPLTTTQVWKYFVQERVCDWRVRQKLHEWTAEGKCYRLPWKGKYNWFFGEPPEEVEI